ncbi:hypothetical protein SAMN05428975_4675 [Mucilaginibacter sp. OK268]|uniref:hypothetical protein n=1 Tax=Mucilaginibacter sp. OK268 TaxID=1881048 RepID=UPI000882FCC6|nr:hypothetical protein [Mucilaginibacter sp. OK268]SDP98250.1 hypothetical protein SAMN05428975_4675 [Mucilaginibacter sp. OK268]
MSENKDPNNFRLNLDKLPPEELFAKLKKLQNDALKEAGESIVGGISSDLSSVIHGSGACSFTRALGL